MSLRKDTLSHAYELMKVDDPKRRRRLADQVARGELTLSSFATRSRAVHVPRPSMKSTVRADLRSDADGQNLDVDESEQPTQIALAPEPTEEVEEPTDRPTTRRRLLVNAKSSLAEALDELVNVLRAPGRIRSIPDVDRDNLAKYLTISKLRLENAIALVRSGDASTSFDRPTG